MHDNWLETIGVGVEQRRIAAGLTHYVPASINHRLGIHVGAPVNASCHCDGRHHRRVQSDGDIDIVPAGLDGDWEDDADCTILRLWVSPGAGSACRRGSRNRSGPGRRPSAVPAPRSEDRTYRPCAGDRADGGAHRVKARQRRGRRRRVRQRGPAASVRRSTIAGVSPAAAATSRALASRISPARDSIASAIRSRAASLAAVSSAASSRAARRAAVVTVSSAGMLTTAQGYLGAPPHRSPCADQPAQLGRRDRR